MFFIIAAATYTLWTPLSAATMNIKEHRRKAEKAEKIGDIAELHELLVSKSGPDCLLN